MCPTPDHKHMQTPESQQDGDPWPAYLVRVYLCTPLVVCVHCHCAETTACVLPTKVKSSGSVHKWTFCSTPERRGCWQHTSMNWIDDGGEHPAGGREGGCCRGGRVWRVCGHDEFPLRARQSESATISFCMSNSGLTHIENLEIYVACSGAMLVYVWMAGSMCCAEQGPNDRNPNARTEDCSVPWQRTMMVPLWSLGVDSPGGWLLFLFIRICAPSLSSGISFALFLILQNTYT